MNRRKLLAVSLGAAGAVAAVGIVGISHAATTKAAAAEADDAVEPAYGAGLFDVDPDQHDISQDPNVAVDGDTTALPEDSEF